MFSAGSIKDILIKFFRLDSLTEDLSGYVEARVELLKIEVREEVAKALTRAMVIGAIVLLGVLCLLFVSLGAALFINQYFVDTYAGFFLVGGFYLILLLLSFGFRKKILQVLERALNNHFKNHKG